MKRIVTVFVVLTLLGGMALAALAAASKDDRIQYVKLFELYLLAKGVDSHIRAEGKDATILRIECASCTRQEAEQIAEQIFKMSWSTDWKKRGFKRAVLTNGHDTWEFNLQK